MAVENPLHYSRKQVTLLSTWNSKANTLVATSLVEGLGRFATKDGIMSRVRPQSYYRPAKSTYSHLFSEVQEAVDMSLLKFQRILFGEDLQGAIVVCQDIRNSLWM